MKLIRLVLLVAFSAFATSSFAQAPMPDYSKWEKTHDHSMSYLLKGKEIQVRDEHYEYLKLEKTEVFRVIVFYSPDTGKAWFAIYIHNYLEEQKPIEAYLYEAGENNAWIFDQDVSKSEGPEAVLKSRYDLIPVTK